MKETLDVWVIVPIGRAEVYLHAAAGSRFFLTEQAADRYYRRGEPAWRNDYVVRKATLTVKMDDA